MLKTNKYRKRPARHKMASSNRGLQKTTLKKRATKKRRRLLLPLHKRLALHPINLLFLLCVGVLLVAWTWHAIAVSYTVSAEVLAPALTQGAQITSPTDGDNFTAEPIEVSGTCPPNSYVEVTRNGQTSGIGWCTSGSFQIQIGLYVGVNILNAQDYNITDNPGPATPNITISYTPPASATNVTLPSTTSKTTTKLVTSKTSPILLSTNFSFQTFETGQTFSTILNIQGGVTPYTLYINWGDGSSQNLSVNTDPTLTISHVYTQHGYYSINITATDSVGTKQYLQTSAFIRIPGATSFLTAPTITQPPKPSLLSRIYNSTKGWLILIWPSYLVVLLMVFSFWLGEKEEYKRLIHRLRHSRRRKSAAHSR